MFKSILKEVLIILLLCLAIVLILGVIFYDYMPTNKVIPNKVAYTTPENIEEEIDETITEIANQVVTVSYKITDSDLSLYKQSKSYVPGKANPFSLTQENVNQAGQNTNVNNTTANPNSTETFFNETGTK